MTPSDSSDNSLPDLIPPVLESEKIQPSAKSYVFTWHFDVEEVKNSVEETHPYDYLGRVHTALAWSLTINAALLISLFLALLDWGVSGTMSLFGFIEIFLFWSLFIMAITFRGLRKHVLAKTTTTAIVGKNLKNLVELLNRVGTHRLNQRIELTDESMVISIGGYYESIPYAYIHNITIFKNYITVRDYFLHGAIIVRRPSAEFLEALLHRVKIVNQLLVTNDLTKPNIRSTAEI